MRRFAVLAAGCLAVLTRAASAQDPALLTGDRDASAQLSKIIETTAAAGLPTDPILDKVYYGNTRHVAGARIVAAARIVASRLEVARVALAPNATSLDIAAGAAALGEGADEASLRAIRRASRSRPVVVPLGFLAQLLAEPNKVKLERATKHVTDLIARGATDGQLIALGNDVNADVAVGFERAASIETRVQGLAAVLSPAGTAAAADAAFSPSTIGQSGRSNPPVPPRRP